MRKFRHAALATATATAVAFGGTSVAIAADGEPKPTATSGSSTTGFRNDGNDSTRKDLIQKLGEQNPVTKIGHATNADTAANSNDFFKNPENMPQWARIWREAFNIVAILAGIGAVIGAGNWALYNGYLPQIPW